MYAVGLMSGTSLDGVDAALVEISGSGRDTAVKLLHFLSTEIPAQIKDEIKRAVRCDTSRVDLICSLNFKLGYLFADAVKGVCGEYGLGLDDLDFIASHGQTIWHIPKAESTHIRSTLQIGEPAVIAFETRTQVVSNFRTMDVAAGGEGAPLVPFSEFILYGLKTENIALQNIGGIGNVTVIPADCGINDTFAFDTGPGNMIIDEAMNCLFGKRYDDNGCMAAKGVVNRDMLDELMHHPYIDMPLPKSTGREMFGEEFTRTLINNWSHIAKEDVIATVTMFTAQSIAYAYNKFVLPHVPLTRIIVGGGGAHNATLMRQISQLLPNIEVLTQDDMGMSSDAKEAIAFAIMGNETLHGKPSNVCSATGARFPVILGNITPVPF